MRSNLNSTEFIYFVLDFLKKFNNCEFIRSFVHLIKMELN